MGLFTKEEILLLLDKVNDGKSGYSDIPAIARIQAKLSLMLAAQREGRG